MWLLCSKVLSRLSPLIMGNENGFFEICWINLKESVMGCVAQLVTSLTADMCLTADPGVGSLVLVRSHTFVEIDHEVMSTAILLPSADSRRVVVSYKRKYVHKVMVNRLVKLA